MADENEESNLLAATLPDEEAEIPPAENDTPPADKGTEVKDAGEGFSSLADALKELEPEISEDTKHTPLRNEKGDVINPPKETKERGEDGKFKSTKTAEETEKTPEQKAAEVKVETKVAEKAPTRDSDIDTTKLDPHLRPPTRKVIEGYADKTKVARNERDDFRRKYEEGQGKIREYEEKLKTIKAPKEMEDELSTLRTRVRELDISKDPEIEAKYDAKIKTNSTTALDILKEQGLFTKIVEKDKPPVPMTESEAKVLTAEIEKGGIGIRGMARYIRALETGGEYEAAERLRALAQHNDRLAQEKSEEIATWSKDFEGFQAEKARDTKASQETYLNNVRTHSATSLQNDIKELSKQLPFLAEPEKPLETDSAEVKAAKEKVLSEYNASAKAVKQAVAIFHADGKPPEQAAEAYGKLTSSAVQGVIFKQVVLPRLMKEIADYKARVTELETDNSKFKKAGTLNRAHSAAITQAKGNEKAIPTDMSFEDAMKMTAKELGVPVDS